MKRLGIGWPLHPDLEYLELTREIIERDVDYFEVNPEALWRKKDGRLIRNDFHPILAEIQARSGKPFVAHGLDFSPGTPIDTEEERERTDEWLARIKDDHSVFDFKWISEHLGWTCADGLQAVLPLPLPFTEEAVATVSDRLRLLNTISPYVAFENNCTYFQLGNPIREPSFFNSICEQAECHILLDLHNVYTQCLNHDLNPKDYIDRINLSHVIQLHVSGGSDSNPEWLPSKKTFRLDSHDGPVPEEVWTLLEEVAPRCPNLKGVVVERLNGTFTEKDVPALADEVRRAREIWKC